MLLAGCAVVINSAFGTYLPELGPSSLRFRPSPAFPALATLFPPLRMDDSPSPANVVSVDLATNPPPAESLEPLGPPPPAESIVVISVTNSVVPPFPVILPDATTRITPQMLVDFFKLAPNGTNEAAMTSPPGSFTPPQLLPPSSTATYRSN